MVGLLVTRDLQDAAFGGQVAFEDHIAASGFERILEIPDDYLARRLGRLRGFLGDGPARNGDRVLVEHTALQHALGHEPVAARGEQVVGDELPARLQVGEQRRLLADPVEILDLQVHARFLCDGQQVQHAVGGTPGGEHG